MDTDINTPVFARKSAPPPPPMEDEEEAMEEETTTSKDTGNPFNMYAACTSTPSSSLLNSSNDNSFVQNTTFEGGENDNKMEESGISPMEEDIPTPSNTQPDPAQGMNQKKPPRSRSRSQKTAAKLNKPVPNIDSLIAGYKTAEQQQQHQENPGTSSASPGSNPTNPRSALTGNFSQLHPPPPLTAPPPPPPPPPPPLPTSKNANQPSDKLGHAHLRSETDAISSRSGKGNTKIPDNNRNEEDPEEQTPEPPGKTDGRSGRNRSKKTTSTKEKRSAGSASRTRGVEDSTCNRTEANSSSGSNIFPSHNRQWTRESASAGTAARNTKGKQHNPTAEETANFVRGEREKNRRQDTNDNEPNRQSDMDVTGAGGNGNDPRILHQNQQEGPPVCLDITSHRFIPDDDKRINILLRKMKGDDVSIPRDRKSIDEGKIEMHNFPLVLSSEVTGVDLSKAAGASQFCGTEDRFVNIAGFTSVERPDTTVYHHIARRNNITFVMVYRPQKAKGIRSWEIPTFSLCQDFVNELLSRLYQEDAEYVTAYARSGKWGKVQTLILHSASLDHLHDFRRAMTEHPYNGFHFDTFPKDATTAKPDVSILLRASMKTFRTELIPKVLFTRNQETLAGALKVLATRHHGAEERSHKGDSKEHWRTIDLQGNEQFMRCLRVIPESKPFLLGYDTVQIRGGLRPDEPTIAGNKRSWSEFPQHAATPLLTDPRNQQQQQQQQHLQLPHRVDENSSPNIHRGNGKRGRPFRGGRRGRFQKK